MSTYHVYALNRAAYFDEEHELLRAQLRRFVEEEIKPHALMGAGWYGAARRAAAHE